jgi:hypothetical protein
MFSGKRSIQKLDARISNDENCHSSYRVLFFLPMSAWSAYPSDYRSAEVQALLAAAQAGECSAVLRLSGAGKSNLLGFLANRAAEALPHALIDCNRLPEPTPRGFWRLVRHSLDAGALDHPTDEFGPLESSLAARLNDRDGRFCLIFDRFDALPVEMRPLVYGELRALRDDHKYVLTYLVASRRPIDAQSELAELFYAHSLWLGPLTTSDAHWSAASYAARSGQAWDEASLARLIELSGGYPAWLRAACEAYASGCPLELPALLAHPALRHRLDEFWSAAPTPDELRLSRLEGIPLLKCSAPVLARPAPAFDTSTLTAKELRLWEAFQARGSEVCEKDDLIRAVWPEDKVFLEGIRDDALAQLVRRLRQKAADQTGDEQIIQTVPGRGYKLLLRSGKT